MCSSCRCHGHGRGVVVVDDVVDDDDVVVVAVIGPKRICMITRPGQGQVTGKAGGPIMIRQWTTSSG